MIRAEIPEDFPAVEEINVRAFGRSNEADLVKTLRTTLPRPDYSRIAVLDGEPVGHILFSPVRIDTGHTYVPALALAPMAVLPEFQSRGIGSALVREGLTILRQSGEKVVIVLGHSGFYPRFGFQTASSFGIQAPFDVPDPAFMLVELQPGVLDGLQGKVRYPSAFDSV